MQKPCVLSLHSSHVFNAWHTQKNFILGCKRLRNLDLFLGSVRFINYLLIIPEHKSEK